MAMLAFNPVTFAAPFRTMDPEEAWHDLVTRRWGSAAWVSVSRPSDPQYLEVGQAIKAAAADIREAVATGALNAYAHLPATSMFFAIPPRYWDGDGFCDILSGRLFVFQSEGRVPPELDNQPIVILEREWLAWAGKYGPAKQTPLNTSGSSTSRKKPGPTRDGRWDEAIAAVAANCQSGGYVRPLKRGERAAIETQLLLEMATLTGIDFSPDTARKYAIEVIERLPECQA